jgi:hypothetical protein
MSPTTHSVHIVYDGGVPLTFFSRQDLWNRLSCVVDGNQVELQRYIYILVMLCLVCPQSASPQRQTPFSNNIFIFHVKVAKPLRIHCAWLCGKSLTSVVPTCFYQEARCEPLPKGILLKITGSLPWEVCSCQERIDRVSRRRLSCLTCKANAWRQQKWVSEGLSTRVFFEQFVWTPFEPTFCCWRQYF